MQTLAHIHPLQIASLTILSGPFACLASSACFKQGAAPSVIGGLQLQHGMRRALCNLPLYMGADHMTHLLLQSQQTHEVR